MQAPELIAMSTQKNIVSDEVHLLNLEQAFTALLQAKNEILQIRERSPHKTLREIINELKDKNKEIGYIISISADQLFNDIEILRAKKRGFPEVMGVWLLELTVPEKVAKFYIALIQFYKAKYDFYNRETHTIFLQDTFISYLLRSKRKCPSILYLLSLSPQEVDDYYVLLCEKADIFLVDKSGLCFCVDFFKEERDIDNKTLHSFFLALTGIHSRLIQGKTLPEIFNENSAESPEMKQDVKFCTLMRPDQIVFDMNRLFARNETHRGLFYMLEPIALKEIVEAEQVRLAREKVDHEREQEKELQAQPAEVLPSKSVLESETTLIRPINATLSSAGSSIGNSVFEENKSGFWRQERGQKAVIIIGSFSALTLLTAGITHFIPSLTAITLQSIFNGLGAKFVLGASMGSVTLPWMLLIAGAILAATAFLLYVGASINKTCKQTSSREHENWGYLREGSTDAEL